MKSVGEAHVTTLEKTPGPKLRVTASYVSLITEVAFLRERIHTKTTNHEELPDRMHPSTVGPFLMDSFREDRW